MASSSFARKHIKRVNIKRRHVADLDGWINEGEAQEIVTDTIMKATKLPKYPLPYVVFLCKVFKHYNVDFFRETSYGHNYTSLIGSNALHHMGMTFRANTWAFKDEPVEEQAENADPQPAVIP